MGRAADITPGRIYRMLFAIGCDTAFLQEDAVLAWALQLATPGVAGVALFYAESPYLKSPNKQPVINAIDLLMMGLQIDGIAGEHRANLLGGEIDEVLHIACKRFVPTRTKPEQRICLKVGAPMRGDEQIGGQRHRPL